ncbi:c-type cytochrome [Rhodocytophaga aerolata]|uniref:C-type cytochrome n=1 Tax=Rhodocytophaga aerolata TaxID=455078 RepID=A0ABT8RDR2_9BACT|nr:c-type cytochrome [Rhodocytophaga aerolata]MDO1450245.1 c-type cytochrome [Rhodocytophaga aerolata]
MLCKILKWTGIGIACLLVTGLLGYWYISYQLKKQLEKTYQVTLRLIQIPDDPALISRGKHLVAIRGCVECHGENMAGKVIIENPALGKLVAPNLTRGKGGIPEHYTATDWLKAIQHGLRSYNTSLTIMPSKEYVQLAQQDMAAIIAYCQSLPPVDNSLPDIQIGPVLRVVNYLGKVNLLSAEDIDHKLQLLPEVNTQVSAAYGKYLSVMCSACHRENLKGGDPVLPGFPSPPNITSSGIIGKVNEAQFMKTLRTGITHQGKQINNEHMPWKVTANFSDDEIKSIYLYLLSLE